MSLFYIIACLPRLTLTDKPLLTLDEFKALCAAQLCKEDHRTVRLLVDGPDYDNGNDTRTHAFVAAWRNREIQIRNAIARLRAARRKTDAAGAVRPHDGFDVYIEEATEHAFDQPDPLERERALDRIRWSVLDELQGVDPFALPVILAYGVKLRLAWRWTTLDAEEGRRRVAENLERKPAAEDAAAA